jgi:hypothetical protein
MDNLLVHSLDLPYKMYGLASEKDQGNLDHYLVRVRNTHGDTENIEFHYPCKGCKNLSSGHYIKYISLVGVDIFRLLIP